jgi:hypothetical protein
MKRNPQLITKTIGKKTIILDPVRGEIRVLNPSGAYIWTRLHRFKTIESIASELVKEFKVDKQKALSDVRKFVTAYIKSGVIIVSKKNNN